MTLEKDKLNQKLPSKYKALETNGMSIFKAFILGCAVSMTASCANQAGKTQVGKTFPDSKKINQYEQLIPYQSFTLANGLTVVVHEDKTAPVVAVNTWYKVGSKHEPKGKTGFAHLFEHLMFNGSEHYDDDLFKPLEKVGAVDMNGTTNSDRTNYFETVPTGALDLALWLESDRMGHLLGAVTQEKLDNQRGVVQNEKRQGDESPYGNAYETVSRLSFPEGHPYSWTTIGSMADLEAATLDDVHQWFKDYYGPNNAVLVLSGDIDLATAKQKVSQYYGDIPASRFIEQPATWVPTYEQNRRYEVTDNVPQERIFRVWNTAALGTDDARSLGLLADILGNHANARLHQRLVLKDELALSVEVWNYSRPLSGQLWVVVDLKPGVLTETVEAIIDEELANLLEGGVSEAELALVVSRKKADFYRGIEKVGGFYGRANRLAAGAVYQNNPGAFALDLAFWDQATPSNLQKVARDWLSKGSLTLVYHKAPELTHAAKGVDRSKIPQVTASDEYQLPEFSQFTLSNGLKVVALPKASVPLIETSLVLDAGYDKDPDGQEGLAKIALQSLVESTETLNTTELNAALDRLGAELGASVDLNSASVSLSALKEHWQASLAYMVAVIQQPGLRSKDIERVKQQSLADIEDQEKQPVAQAMRVLPPLLFGQDHPYGVPSGGAGYRKTVESIDAAAIKGFLAKWIRPDNATLLVVGDFDPVALPAELEAAFADWRKPQQPLIKSSIPATDTVASATGNENISRLYLLDKPKATQSVIVAGALVPGTDSEGYQVLDVANDVFGGAFTSRLNMNIREDKGWAYYAYSRLFDANTYAPWVMYSPVQSDKTLPAILEMKQELQRFVTSKPAISSELQKVKLNTLAKLPGQYETNASLVGLLRKMAVVNHLDSSYLSQEIKALKELKTDGVRVAATRHLNPEKLLWIVVGDKAGLLPKLKKLKGFKIIELD
jgi:zinc protease